jgi:hypothetical protein
MVCNLLMINSNFMEPARGQGEIIIAVEASQAHHIVAFFHQLFGEVKADESGGSRN